MASKFEGGGTQRETSEKKGRHVKIWEDLAVAFGGYSQVPDKVVGMAIIGQVNNNGLKFGKEQFEELVNQIYERWKDTDKVAQQLGVEPDDNEIRRNIVAGMEEEALIWSREENKDVWAVIDTLKGEGRKFM